MKKARNRLKKARKKLEKAGASRPEVPSDIILNILWRLPLKSCVKCKLVCKEWYQLIKSPEFANLLSSQDRYHYLTILPNSKRSHSLLLEIDKRSKVDETGELVVSNGAMISIKTDTMTTLLKSLRCNPMLLNECNGLSLLATNITWHKTEGPGQICWIFNNITGELVAAIHPYENFYAPFYVIAFGLGCCPISEQFKLLSILNNNEARIQTLGSNEWRTVENAPASYPHLTVLNRVFLHGSLHSYSMEDNVIWCFDFETERFWQILTPDGFEAISSDNFYTGVSVFNSCLCLSAVSYKVWREIWVMKEYGVQDSWVKQFIIPVGGVCDLGVPLFEIGNGKILFTATFSDNLKSYDIESKSRKRVKIPGIPSGRLTVVHHSNTIRFSKFW